MNKTITFGIMAACSLAFSSCFAPMPATGTQTTGQTTGTTQNTPQGQDPLNDLLGGIVGAANEKTGLGDVIGNIISSVAGSVTTTQANLIGTWTYYEPSVQFESENLWTQAGGAAAATKVEQKLVNVYKMIGVTPGKLVFTFADKGQMTYSLGSRQFNGTYVFDSKSKTVSITTASGMNLTSYVTISGQNLSLCFDSSKLLTFLGGFSGTNTTLGNLGTIAQSYSGMKTGFKFKK